MPPKDPNRSSLSSSGSGLPPEQMAEMLLMPSLRTPSRRRVQWRRIIRTAVVAVAAGIVGIGLYGIIRGWFLG